MSLFPPTQKQSRIIWFALTSVAVAAVLALVAMAVWGLSRVLDLLSPVLWPLAIAAVIACLFSPMVDFIEHRKVPRTAAILIVFALALAIVLGVAVIVVPKIIDEAKDLASKIPEYSEQLQNRASELIARPGDFFRHVFHREQQAPPAPSPDTKQQAMNKATDWLTSNLPKISAWLWQYALKIFSGLGLLIGLVLVPVYVFYFLREQRVIENRWKDCLPLQDSTAKNEITFVLDAISGYLIAFFRGQVLVAICNGILYIIGFSIIGVKYAYLCGLAAMVLTMIPFLGAVTICISALLLVFVQYGDWLHPALVLLVFSINQSLESLFITPKIMGDRVGLHPVIIIIAVMVGVSLLGGILGGILAIPLAAALRVILFRYVWKRPGAEMQCS